MSKNLGAKVTLGPGFLYGGYTFFHQPASATGRLVKATSLGGLAGETTTTSYNIRMCWLD